MDLKEHRNGFGAVIPAGFTLAAARSINDDGTVICGWGCEGSCPLPIRLDGLSADRPPGVDRGGRQPGVRSWDGITVHRGGEIGKPVAPILASRVHDSWCWFRLQGPTRSIGPPRR